MWRSLVVSSLVVVKSGCGRSRRLGSLPLRAASAVAAASDDSRRAVSRSRRARSALRRMEGCGCQLVGRGGGGWDGEVGGGGEGGRSVGEVWVRWARDGADRQRDGEMPHQAALRLGALLGRRVRRALLLERGSQRDYLLRGAASAREGSATALHTERPFAPRASQRARGRARGCFLFFACCLLPFT